MWQPAELEYQDSTHGQIAVSFGLSLLFDLRDHSIALADKVWVSLLIVTKQQSE